MKKLMFGRYCSTQTRLLTYLYKVEIAEQYANLKFNVGKQSLRVDIEYLAETTSYH